MKIFGFTLLRNAIKYDYCFLESLKSLSSVTNSIFLALGDSEDGTEKAIENFKNIKIIKTKWDESLRKSGLILSQQTNIALDKLREYAKEDKDSWGIYLQADEVIHEKDYFKLKNDIEYAQNNGYDAVRFRYFHFWLNHNTIAIGKKWYPVEVRAIKLDSNITSIKDAQGFENITKVYESDVTIYHYGHVRQKELYELKKNDFHKLYHQDADLLKAKKREEKKYKEGRILPFFGSHPKVMKDRILSFGDVFEMEKEPEIWIINNSLHEIENYIPLINAQKVNIIKHSSQCKNKNKLVILYPTFWQRIFYPSKVLKRPESKLGRDWTFETYLSLKLSEKKISSKI
jgi:hypothetical protein